MSRIPLEIELLPGMAQSLVRPLERLMAQLGKRLPRKMQEPEDAVLGEIWETELIAAFQRDAGRLIAVLGDPAFGRRGYTMETGQLEEMVRGCSALRLTLRRAALHQISDQDLERGLINPEHIPLEHRESIACFWFLGALQELLVSVLDPDSTEGGEADDGLADPSDWV